MSINITIIEGNATRDAELRTTQSGKKVLTFGIANNQRFGDTEKTNFVDCSLWGDRAEKLAPYIKKGTGLFLQGSLDYREWERDGQKRSKIEVIVDELEFMSSRNKTDGYDANAEFAAIPSSLSPDSTASVYDEDIPF